MKLRYIISILAVVIAVVPHTQALSQDSGFGLGVIVGEPTGIKGKIWLTETRAFDFGFGWSVGGFNLDRYDPNDAAFEDASRFHMHADYLIHDFELIQADERLPVYYGVGARLNSGAGYNSSFALRGLVGMAWVGLGTPLDIFLEVAPVFQLNPTTRFGVNGGIGARYFLLR